MGRPTIPLSQYVLKVHSRCDLACDHCYVYQAADQSWRGQPMAMSDEVIASAARRIAEHAESHGLGEVQVVLHGGEPLLAGPARLELIAKTLQSATDGICGLDLRIHTNGVQLDEQFCDLFAAHGVKVGISVDGYRSANDRHRRYADGRSSYAQVLRAVGLLRTPRYADLYAGLLCTIDVANDPVAVYEALAELEPPRIDFLLPHATWDEPPARVEGRASEYADWLIRIFDRWQAAGRPVQVRTFDSIISTSNGGASLTEALGLGPSSLVVIETDGSYEQADSLKAAFDGAPATGLDVFSHSVDMVRQHPGIAARQQGLAGLCATCQACPVVTSCGGGLYAHRFRSGTDFANPSVYCADLLKLITHVRGQAGRELPGGSVRSAAAIGVHVMPDAEFRALAAGFGGATAIGQLAGAQLSLGRALLAAVYQAGRAEQTGLARKAGLARPAEQAAVSGAGRGMDDRVGPAAFLAAAADLESAWNLLASVDRQSPHILAEVIGHPYVRVWAVRCLEQLGLPPGDRAAGGRGLAADLRHLSAIAASAAIRSGLTARLTVPVVDGAVHLPTLGRLVPAAEPATAVIEISADSASVLGSGRQCTLATADLLSGEAAADSDGAGCWQPVRRLTAPGISVALEDTDPYRDCHQWQASPRLTDTEFAAWQHQFRQAWQQIQQQHGGYAAALAAGLGTLMPLAAAPAGREVSATARHAFGAVAAALPADPDTLALLIIHEFQHVKLGAVLDLYDLYDAADDRLFHAPWRDDPRPLEGLLQGTYAHVAVVDFWRARRDAAAGQAADAAEARFSRWHAHTAGAIDVLTASGSLTPLGSEFVAGMRRSLAAVQDAS